MKKTLFSTDGLIRLKALCMKEFLQIVRDPSTLLISLFLPLLLLFIYGYGVSLDLNHLRIGIVMEDTSPDAQSFVKSMTNSRFFDAKIARHRKEFDEDLVSGAVRGIVVIPSYFSRFRLDRGTVAPIQVIADGSEPNTANFVQNYVMGAWLNWLAQENISSNLTGLPLVNFQSRFWYNEELLSHYFLIPGSLGITMTLIGTLLTALVVAREWERGTMEALMSTSVTPFELIMGKLIPYFILAMGSMVLSCLIAVFFFGIPYRGSLLALTLVTGTFLFPALGLGLLISTLSKNQIAASQAAIFSAFLPAFMLSGFIFEIDSMPSLIRAFTYLLPARYFVSSILTLFLVGDIWSLLLYNMMMMVILGSFFYLVVYFKTVKRLD